MTRLPSRKSSAHDGVMGNGERGSRSGTFALDLERSTDRLVAGMHRYADAGRKRESPSAVDVAALARRVVAELRIRPEIRVVIPSSLPVVVAARGELAQVLAELIANAARFCDQRSGRVTLACTDEGESYRFEVADDGPGIDTRDFDRIFQIFQALGEAGREDGTGVGLAIVEKLVERRGGCFWVESRIGEGSRFIFTLPKTCEENAR